MMELYEAIKIAQNLEYSVNLTVKDKGYFIPARHVCNKCFTKEILHEVVRIFIIDFDKELVIIRL